MSARFVSHLVAISMIATIACATDRGGSVVTTSTPDAHAGSFEASSEDPRSPPDAQTGSFEASMAGLRPPGTETVLAMLEDEPQNPEAYTRAAIAYASTDAAGMALLWGLMRAAMTPDMLASEDVARAMVSVLTERVTLTSVGAEHAVSLRLAPGGVPAIADPDGVLHAPVAHIFEMTLIPAVLGFDGTWSLKTVASVLGGYVSEIERGSSLDARVELHPWLLRIARAGHLEAFVYEVLGPAFPAERAAFDSAAVDAMRRYVRANPLRPTHALLPDDLVQIREAGQPSSQRHGS